MDILIKSFIAGFLVASLPGAVQTTVFQSALNRKTWVAMKFAFGASLMDGGYMFLALFGSVQFLEYKSIISVLTFVGGGYIIYLGISSLRESLKEEVKSFKDRKFWEGILLVLLHPPTVLYFLSVVKTFGAFHLDIFSIIISVVITIVGSAIGFFTVSMLGRVVEKISSFFIIKLFRFLTSLLLIVFGVKIIFF